MKYAQNKWDEIRKHYAASRGAIEKASPWEWAIDPYAWDEGRGLIFMTPIEAGFWHDARAAGLVLYPQYPVLSFFVDFANPAARIAVECDGAQFHKDKAKDELRDAELARHGWTVYRLTGRQCNQDFNEETREFSEPAKLCQYLAKRHRISDRFQ